jgi:hypothetical protein
VPKREINMPSQVAITGNTYPVKDALKAMGARWNADAKAWMVSADKADAAQKIVTNAPAAAPLTPGKCRKCGGACKAPYTLCWNCKPAPTKCIVCGCEEGKRNSRGYIDGPRILRNGECGDCYEERKMGY